MSQVSRPMQIALAAVVLLALVWMVALRPKSQSADESAAPAPAPAQSAPAASDGGAAPGTAGLHRAIDKAHDAAGAANGDAQRAQQTDADATGATGGATSPATSAPAQSGSATASPQARGGRHHTAGGGGATAHAANAQVHAVKVALRRHKAIAIAFVSPKTADARAVAREIRHVSKFGGRAVTLAVPLAQLADYSFITSGVEVTVAPTVVLVDRHRHATTIVGFADRGEIEQRLADALAAKRRG